MFVVHVDTAYALFQAQAPQFKRRLRIDLSPSYRPRDMRGPLDPRAAPGAVGERTLQVMGNYAEYRRVVRPRDGFAVLLVEHPPFIDALDERLARGFGLAPPAESECTRGALARLAREFVTWVKDAPDEAREFRVSASHFPRFELRLAFRTGYRPDIDPSHRTPAPADPAVMANLDADH